MKLLKTFDRIAAENKDGEYIALGKNGKKYNAKYASRFGCMFCCVPKDVTVVGYFEK